MNDHSFKITLPQELLREEIELFIQEKPIQYDEPLIQFVDQLIQHATQQRASDIHIESYEHCCRIRFRKDGILYVISEIPKHISSRLITRLKVMAKLDITEKRLPQDGRFKHHFMDVRINTCPAHFGEKIVLRLLDANQFSLDIDQLGMNAAQKNIFLKKITRPQGLILITGPTGSGKTLTLYSALNYLNSTEKNILTVEDPIEIKINGINQVNIHPKIGLDFSHVLRNFLRQDPDIIMVGEIRDLETAKIAVQAAQTGHLVLSTLHTNNTLETLTRLRSIGVEPHQIISSISLIIAQRLVRKICAFCNNHAASLCANCVNGYEGRTAIYEFLEISNELSELILTNSDLNTLEQQAKKQGFISLYDAGHEKVNQGITTLAELQRAVI
jgi:type IV pilus assembly protein PilB